MDQRQSLGPLDQQAAVVPDPEWPPVVEVAGVVEPAEVEADSSFALGEQPVVVDHRQLLVYRLALVVDLAHIGMVHWVEQPIVAVVVEQQIGQQVVQLAQGLEGEEVPRWLQVADPMDLAHKSIRQNQQCPLDLPDP
jgi:hypothetical protein